MRMKPSRPAAYLDNARAFWSAFECERALAPEVARAREHEAPKLEVVRASHGHKAVLVEARVAQAVESVYARERGQVELVLDEHELPDAVRLVQAARGVREHQHAHAQLAQHPHVERALPVPVALVRVRAPLQQHQRLPAESPEQQVACTKRTRTVRRLFTREQYEDGHTTGEIRWCPHIKATCRTGVAYDSRRGKVGNVGKRDAHDVGERVGDAGEAGATHYGDDWREVAWQERPNVRGRLPHHLGVQLVCASAFRDGGTESEPVVPDTWFADIL